MAFEATIDTETGLPIQFTVADTPGISKGSIMKLTDPFTAVISSADNDIVAGITFSEKISGSGITKIGIYREGVFKVKLSGACLVGDDLRTEKSGNHVAFVNSVLSGSKVIGSALETGADGDTIFMELKPQGGGNR